MVNSVLLNRQTAFICAVLYLCTGISHRYTNPHCPQHLDVILPVSERYGFLP